MNHSRSWARGYLRGILRAIRRGTQHRAAWPRTVELARQSGLSDVEIQAVVDEEETGALPHEHAVTATITCPVCGHASMELMPTTFCLYFYTCKSCRTVLKPKHADGCVFSLYGDRPCPLRYDATP